MLNEFESKTPPAQNAQLLLGIRTEREKKVTRWFRFLHILHVGRVITAASERTITKTSFPWVGVGGRTEYGFRRTLLRAP